MVFMKPVQQAKHTTIRLKKKRGKMRWWWTRRKEKGKSRKGKEKLEETSVIYIKILIEFDF